MLNLLLQASEEATKFIDLKLFDAEDFTDLVIRFLFNYLVVFILIKFIYRSDKKNKNFAFSFYMFSIIIFFLCYLLSGIKLDMGFAFGLFAIFSILRYRTISIPMKEMTYLFMVIAIAVINALTTKKISFVELAFTNVVLIAASFFLERLWYKEGLSEQTIEYEKIENIKPERRAVLIADLKERTGLDIRSAEILTTDFLRDMARVRIYYKAAAQSSDNDNGSTFDDDDD
jgi:hypothetical protein